MMNIGLKISWDMMMYHSLRRPPDPPHLDSEVTMINYDEHRVEDLVGYDDVPFP